MTTKADDRPTPRRRPRPAPDADRDPMDMQTAAETSTRGPAVDTAAASKPVTQRGAGTRARGVKVTAKDPDIEARAVVQLGVRVSTKVDAHLEQVAAASGRTKRELVEMAILALEVPN